MTERFPMMRNKRSIWRIQKRDISKSFHFLILSSLAKIRGEAKIDAIELVRVYRAKARNPKPIIALVAGRTAPREKTMDHAEALLSPKDASAQAKAKVLEQAGVVFVPHPRVMDSKVKRLLGEVQVRGGST